MDDGNQIHCEGCVRGLPLRASGWHYEWSDEDHTFQCARLAAEVNKPAHRAAISTVIPAYNAERTIGASIESALTQEEPPTEIVVVDDGSTDNTAAVAARYPLVRVLRQQNRGPGPARALGTLEAKSDYIAYLDADDWFLEGWLKRARDIIQSDEIHLLFADLRRGEPGSKPGTWGPPNANHFPWLTAYSLRASSIGGKHPVMRFGQADAWELFLRGFPLYPSTVVASRAAVIDSGNWSGDYRRAEDLDFSLRMSKRYGVHFLDRVVSVLGLHEVNRNKDGYVKLQSGWDLKVLAGHLRDSSAADAPRLRRALADRYCQFGWHLTQMGLLSEAREAYRQAMRYGRRFHAAIRWLTTIKPAALSPDLEEGSA